MAENKPKIIEDKPELIEDKPEIIEDKPKTLRAPSRTTILEDGTTKYNNKPLDPLYFVKYYHTTRKFKEAIIIKCDLCNRETTAGHKHRHQKTNICKKLYNLRLINESQ